MILDGNAKVGKAKVFDSKKEMALDTHNERLQNMIIHKKSVIADLKQQISLLKSDKRLLIDFINHLDDVVVDGEHFEYYQEWINKP